MRDQIIADSSDIKFACSQCGQRMVVERSAAGVTADCPVCLSPVTVPHHEGESEPVHGEVEVEAPAPPVRAPREAPQTREELEAELAEARAEIARQHSLFKKAVDECERMTANAMHVQAELKTFQTDRQQLKAELAQTRLAVQTADANISELAVALSQAQQENATMREQLSADIGNLQNHLSTTETHLAGREAELEQCQGELSQALRALAKTKSELTASVTEASGLRSELEAHQHGLQTTGQQLNAAKTQLRALQTQLENLTAEHQQASEQRDDWQQRAEGFERDLTAIDSGRDLLETRAQLKQLQQEHKDLGITLAERTEAATKSQDVLRGIVDRQNATLAGHHAELRRLRRARFAVRLVYGLFSLGLVALGLVAFYILAPQQFHQFLEHPFGHVLKH